MDNDFGGDGLAMAEAYFASVAEVAAKKPDILGHFDLIKKLNCTGAYFDENSPRYKAAALAALDAARKADCLLEVNTGGVYRGYRNDFYPSFWLLEEWRKMGGRVVITADAHNCESLTFGYADAADLLRSAGFTEVQVLTANGFESQEL
jgi:histidinol-phosphatase (PHP family)